MADVTEAPFCIAVLQPGVLLHCVTNVPSWRSCFGMCPRESSGISWVSLIQIKPRMGISVQNPSVSFRRVCPLSGHTEPWTMDQSISTKGIVSFLFAAALVVACPTAFGAEQPSYVLDVALDPPGSRIAGTATIELSPGAEVSIEPGDLRILSVTNGSIRAGRDADGLEHLTLHADGLVQIRYEGAFNGPGDDVIDKEKITLRGIWYPVVEGTYRYHLIATLPRDFVAVSEADAVRRTEADGQATFSFDLPYPQRDWDGITFVASTQWASRVAKYKDIDVSIHVHRRNAERLDEMVGQAQRYLERLEGLLGKYPFKRLTIVENPAPITYSLSMFTYILLSQRVVTAVTPEENALNHEIAHQWFGNAVLADDEGGNWAEGLASYFSDDLENETMGRAWERRQRRMATYQNNVDDRGAAFPLSSFDESNDYVSKFIGYGKSAIVVHMLRRLVGDENFFPAMREFVAENRFRVASWTNIQRALERAMATDLGWFFGQWVEGVAMPELSLEGVSVAPVGDKHELQFAVTQKRPALRLTVPAAVYFEGGRSEMFTLQVSNERNDFRYLLNEKPVRIVLDEGYDVFRRLTPAEMPPTIDNLLTRPRVALVASPDEEKKFASLIKAFESEETRTAGHGLSEERAQKGSRRPPTALGRQSGATTNEWKIHVLSESDIGARTDAVVPSLILLGKDNPLISKLFGKLDLPRGGFTVTVLKHPKSPGNVVAILTAVSSAEVDAAYGEIINRPRYSSAVFDMGKLISRELRQGQRGISVEVAAEQR